MFCSNCGKEILEGSKFCSNCGEKIKTIISIIMGKIIRIQNTVHLCSEG